MKKNLSLISLAFLVVGIVLGGPLIAKAGVVQSLLIGVKQDPGGGFTNADLKGRYWFSRLGISSFEPYTSIEFFTNDTADLLYGYIDFNGAGLWNGNYNILDSYGATGNHTLNGTYSVNDDGSFSFIFDSEIITGHISMDAVRNFGILSTGYEDAGKIHHAIITAVKAPVVPIVLADLNGTWQYRDLEVRGIEVARRDASACKTTFVFNNPFWSADYNCFDSDGTTNIGSFSGNYKLNANGDTFNLFETGDPDVLFSVNLSRDKRILIFSGGSLGGSGVNQYTGIALKETAKAFTNADLSGTYFYHDLSFEDFETDNDQFEVTVGTVNFDGNGNWTATSESFESDGGSTNFISSGTYSVDPHGSFTLTNTSETPNSTLTGNISNDNDTIIMNQVETITIISDGCPNDPNKTGPGICGCGIPDTDSDSDGIPDCEEQGPNGNDQNFDGNNDGTADSLQNNVGSFHTFDHQNYVTIETPAGTSIKNCNAADNPSSTDAPSDVEFSYGFFKFAIDGLGIGSATTVALHLPVGETIDTYYKFGSTPNNTTNHWYEFLYDGQTGAEINGNVIILHFIDGMRGDDDLTANGIVVDVGAPAKLVETSGEGDGSNTVASDGGGDSNCFIATAAYGSLMEPHVKILRDFRDKYLLNNSLGKGFVKAYYRYSPPIADFISKHDNLRAVVRISLLPVVGVSWVALKIGPSSTVLLMLIFITCFIGIVWFRRRYNE